MNAGHGEGGALVNRDDTRRGVGAGHQRDMFGVRQIDVSDEPALADDETAVLAHTPVGRDKPILLSTQLRSSEGRLDPRMRSAASAIASTIWA